MKANMILMIMAAAMVLAAGCTSSTEYSANYSAEGSAGNASSAGAHGGAGSSEPAAAGGNGSSSGTTQPEGGQGAAPQTGQELSGKSYSDLIGAGSASMCDVTYTSETGGTAKLKLYFSGAYQMRMEQDTGYADCPTAVGVYQGDSAGNGKLYVSCPGHEEEALGQKFGTHEQCMWKSMDIEEQWGGIGTSSMGLQNGYSTPMIEYLDSPQYSCRTWTLDASKFEASGYVCD
jgi:hypothetical protein